jgi:uncharacterized membrane protein YebE (DUF533 family)
LYYSALPYKALKNTTEYKSSLKKAKELYVSGRKMVDPYTTPMDKVYLESIENELKMADKIDHQ